MLCQTISHHTGQGGWKSFSSSPTLEWTSASNHQSLEKEWRLLSKRESEWPDQRVHLEDLTDVDPEAKKGILVNATTVEENTDVMQQLTIHFSSLIWLKKAVAWLIRVKGTLVNLSKKRKEINESYKDQEQVNKEMTSYKESQRDLPD